MDTPIEESQLTKRYQNDPKFHRLVDVLSDTLVNSMFTFSELQDALVVAKNRAMELELLRIRDSIGGDEDAKI